MTQNLVEIEKSKTLFINEISAEEIEKGRDIVRFGFGQSPFLPPENVINALKENAYSKEYTPVQGLPQLRRKIADFHSKLLMNTTFQEDQVFIAGGSKILLFNIMLAFEKATLFLVGPSWVSYEPQGRLLKHPVERIQTTYEDRWRLTPETLRHALTKSNYSGQKLMILNYPGNPDGLSYSPQELTALAAVAREHNLIIIADEIYGLLDFKGLYYSMADYYPEGTIVTTGLSKWCGAGGWRLGVALLPHSLKGEFKEVLLGIGSETYSCAASPIQHASLTAYNSLEALQPYLTIQRQALKIIGEFCSKSLRSIGINCHDPVGGFYIFPEFEILKSYYSNASDLCNDLLVEAGVALLPGSAFGLDEKSLTARLAFVDFDGPALLNAVQKDGVEIFEKDNFLELYCPKVKKGIHSLINWCQSKG